MFTSSVSASHEVGSTMTRLEAPVPPSPGADSWGARSTRSSRDQLNLGEVRPVCVRGVVVLILHGLPRRGLHDDTLGSVNAAPLLHRIHHAVGLHSLDHPHLEGADVDPSYLQLELGKLLRLPLEHRRKSFEARCADPTPRQAEVQVVDGQLHLFARLVLRILCGRGGGLALRRAVVIGVGLSSAPRGLLGLAPVAPQPSPQEDRQHGYCQKCVEPRFEARRVRTLLCGHCALRL
mmetsp:Transcript_47637/g.96129  ORF Transcript_47637/g.96129 Transcript_47637/m.96129 type:complete len:235 (-) Transcript_47637:64-768(-)